MVSKNQNGLKIINPEELEFKGKNNKRERISEQKNTVKFVAFLS